MALTDLPGEVPDRTDPRASSVGASRDDRRLGRSGDPRIEDPDSGRGRLPSRTVVNVARTAVPSVTPDPTVSAPEAPSADVEAPTQAVPTLNGGKGEANGTRSEVDGGPSTKAVTTISSRPVPPIGTDGARVGAAEVLVRPVTPAEESVAEATVEPAAPKPRKTVTLRRPRPRVRRVRRVIRSIDTWTVFKVSVLFYIVAYAVALVAGVLLWNLAYTTGTIENIQNFFKDFGWNNYQFYGDKIFHSAWIIGMFLVVAGTGLNVTLAVLFNLISDLVGGVGVTVLEEEVRLVPVEAPPNAPGAERAARSNRG